MKNSTLILMVLCLSLVFGCAKSPVGPQTATVDQQQTATSPAATATTVVTSVPTAVVTTVSTVVVTPVPTATAVATVIPPTPIPTATVVPNIHNYYVTIKGTQAGNVDAYVGKWSGAVPIFTRTTYYMDATYNFLWTSTVIQVDHTTETFHLEGICLDQSVLIIVYKDGVIRTQWTQPANNTFAYND
jgi:hypothetical protein